MAGNYSYQGGVLREQWDSVAGTYTRWDENAVQAEQRALTPAEAQVFSDQAAANATLEAAVVLADGTRGTLRGKMSQALAVNATYLAIATPTAAQNAAQAKALTRQVNALIKLLLNDVQDVNGT